MQVQREVGRRKFAAEQHERVQLQRAIRQRQLQLRTRNRAATAIQTSFRLYLTRGRSNGRANAATDCLVDVVRAFVVRRSNSILQLSAAKVQAAIRGHQARASFPGFFPDAREAAHAATDSGAKDRAEMGLLGEFRASAFADFDSDESESGRPRHRHANQVSLGLGRIVVLRHRSSTSYQIR